MNQHLHKFTVTRKDLFGQSYLFPEEEVFDEDDDELKEELEENKLLYVWE